MFHAIILSLLQLSDHSLIMKGLNLMTHTTAVAPQKTCHLSKLIFIAAIIALPSTVVAAPAEKPKLECTVTRSKSVRIKGGDWDDKTEKVSFDISVFNNSLSKPVESLRATFFVIGEDASDRKKFKLLQKEEFSFSLEPRAKHETTTPEIELKWDDTGAIFGDKYKGWVLQIYDSTDEILVETASSSFLQSTGYLTDMSVGDNFDKTGEPLGRR